LLNQQAVTKAQTLINGPSQKLRQSQKNKIPGSHKSSINRQSETIDQSTGSHKSTKAQAVTKARFLVRTLKSPVSGKNTQKHKNINRQSQKY